VVLAGPTAVGKGSVAADIREHHPEVWISVSATTRAARPGELNGVHYWFVSDEEFDRMIAEDDLLEWAVVHGERRYGTPPAGLSAAQRTAITQAADHLSSDSTVSAAAGIDQQARDVCKIQLGM
jgi:guanylate kinase